MISAHIPENINELVKKFDLNDEELGETILMLKSYKKSIEASSNGLLVLDPDTLEKADTWSKEKCDILLKRINKLLVSVS